MNRHLDCPSYLDLAGCEDTTEASREGVAAHEYAALLLRLDEFTRAYIDCLLWICTGDKDVPLDDLHFGPDKIASDSLDKIIAECEAFQREHKRALGQALARFDFDAESAGRDFALTRNGEGAGFWDRGLGTVGKVLTDACGFRTKYPAVMLYVGDDGLLHYGEG